jgi:sugar transferase EpsL
MERFFDLILILPGIILISPILIITSILVRINLGSPILFCQPRPGLNGNRFTLFKFRTMKNLFDKQGRLLPDEKRLTGFGRFLRKTSLDELPELFNVIKGDMRLVGPRPLLMEYLDRYTPEQMRRHHVKPGITGWAQVNGRNALTWQEKFKLDVWYVDHKSFRLDLKILLLTIWKILKCDGISHPGHVTMERFMG